MDPGKCLLLPPPHRIWIPENFCYYPPPHRIHSSKTRSAPPPPMDVGPYAYSNTIMFWVVSVFINVLLCYLLMIIESLWIKSIWYLVQFLKRNRKCNLPLFCVALLDDDAYCYYPKSLNGKSGCLEVAKICIIYYK